MTTTRQMILSPVCAEVAALALAYVGHAAAQVLGPPPSVAQPPAAGMPAPAPGVQSSTDWRASLAELKLTPRGDLVRTQSNCKPKLQTLV